MGILTEVVNGPTGKSYRISTVELKRIGGWQTAVFPKRRGLLGRFRPSLLVAGVQRARIQHDLVELIVRERNPDEWEKAKCDLAARLSREDLGVNQEIDTVAASDGNPSFSADVDAFLNSPAIAARRQEERVLSLKLAEQLADNPKAIRAATPGRIETKGSGTETAQDAGRSDRLWNSLQGIPNTDHILVQKGEIIFKLIMMAVEDGKSAALIVLQDRCSTLTQQNDFIARVEIAAFLFYIIEKFAEKFTPNASAILMGVVENHIKEKFSMCSDDQMSLLRLLRERCVEYGQYRRWSIETTQNGRPLFWDFSKRMGDILDLDQNYLFNLILTSLLLRRIDDWDLQRLLTGE